jgi:transcriptional regulator of arginine metabolism
MNQYTTFADKFPLPAPSFQETEVELTGAEEASHRRDSGLAGRCSITGRFRIEPSFCSEKDDEAACILIQTSCIFMQVRPRTAAALSLCSEKFMKFQRHNAIRELIGHSLVANQDELRRKLRRRGFAVTQATLSRDIHELRLSKGPGGYSLPNGHTNGNAIAVEDDAPPSVSEMIESFGLRVQQAMNQVVVSTVMGGAQPVAAALDYEEWPDVVGTVAGDDTVLVICPDQRKAAEVESRLRTMLES